MSAFCFRPSANTFLPSRRKPKKTRKHAQTTLLRLPPGAEGRRPTHSPDPSDPCRQHTCPARTGADHRRHARRTGQRRPAQCRRLHLPARHMQPRRRQLRPLSQHHLHTPGGFDGAGRNRHYCPPPAISAETGRYAGDRRAPQPVGTAGDSRRRAGAPARYARFGRRRLHGLRQRNTAYLYRQQTTARRDGVAPAECCRHRPRGACHQSRPGIRRRSESRHPHPHHSGTGRWLGRQRAPGPDAGATPGACRASRHELPARRPVRAGFGLWLPESGTDGTGRTLPHLG